MVDNLLYWKFLENENKWVAFNNADIKLGVLVRERVGSFMLWVWYQKAGIGMSGGYLQDVRNKQNTIPIGKDEFEGMF